MYERDKQIIRYTDKSSYRIAQEYRKNAKRVKLQKPVSIDSASKMGLYPRSLQQYFVPFQYEDGDGDW